MKRASDDVPDDWSPLLGSVNHVDSILDERPLCANSGHSPKLPFTIKPDAEHGGRWPSALDALR